MGLSDDYLLYISLSVYMGWIVFIISLVMCGSYYECGYIILYDFMDIFSYLFAADPLLSQLKLFLDFIYTYMCICVYVRIWGWGYKLPSLWGMGVCLELWYIFMCYGYYKLFI
jgi:hypothetical protein